MNEFAWIAEELTLLEERTEAPHLAMHSAALRRALQRAFAEACQASRELRRSSEAQALDKGAGSGKAARKALARAR